MARVHALISVHTEDCINAETDEVPLRLAEICSRYGCRAVFKVTTEKARALQRHGREDVIEALKTQCLGYHMTNHSIPPTVPVYTQEMSWDEGVAEFERVERLGYEEWTEIFAREATTYCHGTDTPFAFPALRKWGIPTYTWGCRADIDGGPQHLMGLLMLPALGDNGFHLGFRLGEEGVGAQLTGEFAAIYERLRRADGGMVHISSHECEWVTEKFWDENFRQGELVLPEDYRKAPLKSREQIERGYDDLEKLVAHISGCDEAEIIAASQFHELYHDRIAGTELAIEQVAGLARAATEEIAFHPVGAGYVSAAEIFGLVVAALSAYFAEGALPEQVRVEYLGGPPRDRQTAAQTKPMSVALFRHVLADVADYVAYHERVPAEVWCGNYPISPGDFLATMCEVLLAVVRNGQPTDGIEIAQGKVTCTRHAPAEAGVSTWPAFPPGFADHNGVAMDRLQTWTLKPATRG